MQVSVHNVEPRHSHVLLAQHTVLCRQQETGVHVLLYLMHILTALGEIKEHVRSLSKRTKAPNFVGIVFVKAVFLSKDFSS